MVEHITNERGERKVLMDEAEYERSMELVEDAEDLVVAREELAKLERGKTERALRAPR